jgi:hypothetical protein
MSSKLTALREGVALGLGGAVVVALAACGTTGGSESSPTEPAPESSPAAENHSSPEREPTKADEPATDAPAAPATAISEPCDLTDPETVAAVFGGRIDAEQPGNARNCTYAVTGGSVDGVEVYYYGTASEWDGIRAGYEANRGPLTDVPAVGDLAYHPGDVGASELVVRSGEVVFAVGLSGALSDDAAAPKVKQLAVRVAESVG